MTFEPIIKSFLDDDLYKLTMGSVVFHDFPYAGVQYEFINRGKTPFPPGFATCLEEQLSYLGSLTMTLEEKKWLNTLDFLRPTYIEWLYGYRFNTNDVWVAQHNGDLEIVIYGPWYRTILWEVKLMAIISELYFKMTKQEIDCNAYARIHTKAKKLSDAGCQWMDFGTRRRFSYGMQNEVVYAMREYAGFLGTSNPHLAMKYGVKAHGTYAHESVMAMSALYGVRQANKMWMKHWVIHFQGKLAIALTDTFTTDSFLNDFGPAEARLFDGLRQDSGSPGIWGEKIMDYYKRLGIDSRTKKFVFSDNLTDAKYIGIHNTFKSVSQPIGGIGTFLTNDCGVKPLNMVIKMTKAKFGRGWVNVVKLSDEPGKHTGDPVAIARAKEELGII